MQRVSRTPNAKSSQDANRLPSANDVMSFSSWRLFFKKRKKSACMFSIHGTTQRHTTSFVSAHFWDIIVGDPRASCDYPLLLLNCLVLRHYMSQSIAVDIEGHLRVL
jgi:hypothetical protein